MCIDGIKRPFAFPYIHLFFLLMPFIYMYSPNQDQKKQGESVKCESLNY